MFEFVEWFLGVVSFKVIDFNRIFSRTFVKIGTLGGSPGPCEQSRIKKNVVEFPSPNKQIQEKNSWALKLTPWKIWTFWTPKNAGDLEHDFILKSLLIVRFPYSFSGIVFCLERIFLPLGFQVGKFLKLPGNKRNIFSFLKSNFGRANYVISIFLNHVLLSEKKKPRRRGAFFEGKPYGIMGVSENSGKFLPKSSIKK